MLHIKHRPKSFDQIIGHKEIVKSLESLFHKEDKPHSILFSGPSGCGKTTFARILANGLNAEVSEINVANTSGIDFIRELDEVSRLSSIFNENKVFILDECQQLSKEAMNCLLKITEDAPKQAYFFLCTTDPNKLLSALRNRCTTFTLKPLSNKDIEKLISNITREEKIEISEDVLNLIIYKSEGCPRKSLVYLNQVRDVTDLDEAVKLLADELEEEADCIELCKLLIKKPKPSWQEVIKVFNNIKTDPEQIRIIIAGYLAGCLKRDKYPDRFGNMLELFLNPLTYGTGKSEIVYLLFKAYML